MDLKPLILIDTAIIGGPGRGLFQSLARMKQDSIDYLLCNFRYRSPKSTEFNDEAEARQAKLAHLDQSFRLDPRPIFKIIKIVRSGRFSLVQSHGYKSHALALIVAKLFKLPWLAFAHGWTAEDSKVKLYHQLDRFFLRYATAVVTVSPQLREIFTQIRGVHKPTYLLLNAVEHGAIPKKLGGEAIREKYGLGTNSILIGCFGRLSFEKGQDLLLTAFKELNKHHPDSKLLILGDGPQLGKLKAQSADLGIKESVFFMSHDKNVGDYYEAIDLLVLPSRSEGLPNVVLEAMSFSVPVIATRVGALTEIISDGVNGWLVPPENPSLLANRICEAISNRPMLREVGITGCKSLYPKFSPNARSGRILGLYKELCPQ